MKRAWNWLAYYLPEGLLRSFDRVPFVVHTRPGFHRVESSAFQLGRDYEHGQQRG